MRHSSSLICTYAAHKSRSPRREAVGSALETVFQHLSSFQGSIVYNEEDYIDSVDHILGNILRKKVSGHRGRGFSHKFSYIVCE